MLNKAQVIGNMGSDPKISVANNGQTKIASFSVATTERGYTTQNGAQIPDKTEWHNIVCFGKLAEIVEKYLRKGAKVFVEGKMRTRSYEDKTGAKRTIMEINAEVIEMLDSRTQSQQQQSQQITQQFQYPSQGNSVERDLPF